MGGDLQDYLECLHHRKEIARMNTILQEAKRHDDAASGVCHPHRPPPPPPSLSPARQDDAAARVRHTHHTAHASFSVPATARVIRASITRKSVSVVCVDDTAMSACVVLTVSYPCASRPALPPVCRRGHQHQQRIDVTRRSQVWHFLRSSHALAG